MLSRHKDTTPTTTTAKIIFLILIIIFHREDIRHYREEELSLVAYFHAQRSCNRIKKVRKFFAEPKIETKKQKSR